MTGAHTPGLLPCPFCGGQAEITGITETWIDCCNDQCISRGGFNNYGNRHEAIAAWNTRLPASPDLLAVAESVVAWADHQMLLFGEFEEPPFVTAARAAIAKAKGVA